MQPYQEEEAPALHRLRQTLVDDLTERGYSADAVWRQFQRNFY